MARRVWHELRSRHTRQACSDYRMAGPSALIRAFRDCCHIRSSDRPDMHAPDSLFGDGEGAESCQAPGLPRLQSPHTSQSLPSQDWTVQTMPASAQARERSMPHTLPARRLPHPLFLPSQLLSHASSVFRSSLFLLKAHECCACIQGTSSSNFRSKSFLKAAQCHNRA
jgi:hypothetical protein